MSLKDLLIVVAFFLMVLAPCFVALNSSIADEKSPFGLFLDATRARLRRIL